MGGGVRQKRDYWLNEKVKGQWKRETMRAIRPRNPIKLPRRIKFLHFA